MLPIEFISEILPSPGASTAIHGALPPKKSQNKKKMLSNSQYGNKRTTKSKYKGVPISGKFVPILWDELDSPAYQELSGGSAKLYNYLKKAARTVAHDDRIPEREAIFDFTYTEAKKHGFHERTFIRCLKELWNLGFIHVIERGGLRGTRRSNSKYRLCRYWMTYKVKDGWTDRSAVEPNPFLNPCEP